MKLKKGSAEAKRFMASIRAKKKGAKKVSGVKKTATKKAPTKKTASTHKDSKSHNVRISVISGQSKIKLDSDQISCLRSIAKSLSILYKRNSYGDNKLKNRQFTEEAFSLLLEVLITNGYTTKVSTGKLIKLL